MTTSVDSTEIGKEIFTVALSHGDVVVNTTEDMLQTFKWLSSQGFRFFLDKGNSSNTVYISFQDALNYALDGFIVHMENSEGTKAKVVRIGFWPDLKFRLSV